MKIVYLLKQDAHGTVRTIMEHHKEAHEVLVLDIRENKAYDEIIDHISSSDKIICW